MRGMPGTLCVCVTEPRADRATGSGPMTREYVVNAALTRGPYL